MNFDSLITKYPVLYSHLAYFECDGGWFNLIDELSAKLEQINIQFNDPNVVITAAQVKQKYGTLRFYADFSDAFYDDSEKYNKYFKIVQDLIDEAEKKSAVTCELCSSPAHGTVGRAYVQTLCEKCYSK